MADIVDDFLRRMRALCPEVGAGKLQRLELDVRAHWGGADSLYVAKRLGQAKQSRLGEELAKGASIERAFEAAGVSRRQGYRILAKPAR